MPHSFYESDMVEQLGAPARPAQRRTQFLYLLMAALLLIILGRTWQLQIVRGSTYRSQAEGNRVVVKPLPAARGIIYDRHGRQLLQNVASTDVVFNPILLPAEEHEAPLVELLPTLLDLTPETIREALQLARSSLRLTPLAKAIDHETVIALESAAEKLPGVQLVSSSVRQYHNGHAMAAVIGYTSLVNESELAQRERLALTDTTGKAGLERQYDDQLRGVPGASYVETTAAGFAQKEVDHVPAVAGADIYLALDSELQGFIFDLLAERASKIDPVETSDTVGAAAVVALDPRNGEVLALVSYPSFDPSIFSQPSLRNELPNVLTSEERPLFNRALAGSYPPGSTIKPLLAAAGLEAGIISPQTTVLSTGGVSIGPWHYRKTISLSLASYVPRYGFSD